MMAGWDVVGMVLTLMIIYFEGSISQINIKSHKNTYYVLSASLSLISDALCWWNGSSNCKKIQAGPEGRVLITV